jgi:hypothetical protein
MLRETDDSPTLSFVSHEQFNYFLMEEIGS